MQEPPQYLVMYLAESDTDTAVSLSPPKSTQLTSDFCSSLKPLACAFHVLDITQEVSNLTKKCKQFLALKGRLLQSQSQQRQQCHCSCRGLSDIVPVDPFKLWRLKGLVATLWEGAKRPNTRYCFGRPLSGVVVVSFHIISFWRWLVVGCWLLANLVHERGLSREKLREE